MGVTIGNKIELIHLDQVIKNDKNAKVYLSKVCDIMQNNTLQIAMPIYDGKIVPLAVDDKYSACFYTDGGLYQVNVLITSRYKSGNLFFLDVKMLGDLEKVQRREYYRYNCILDAKLRIVTENDIRDIFKSSASSDTEEQEWEEAKIIDISGGGIKLVPRKDFPENSIVNIRFELFTVDHFDKFNLLARILQSSRTNNNAELYMQRLEFVKIGHDDRDKIIRFIFENERINRAKETGLI